MTARKQAKVESQITRLDRALRDLLPQHHFHMRSLAAKMKRIEQEVSNPQYSGKIAQDTPDAPSQH